MWGMSVPGVFSPFFPCSKFFFNPGCHKELHLHFPTTPKCHQKKMDSVWIWPFRRVFAFNKSSLSVEGRLVHLGACGVCKELRVFCGGAFYLRGTCPILCSPGYVPGRGPGERGIRFRFLVFLKSHKMLTRSLPPVSAGGVWETRIGTVFEMRQRLPDERVNWRICQKCLLPGRREPCATTGSVVVYKRLSQTR